MLTFKGSGRKR